MFKVYASLLKRCVEKYCTIASKTQTKDAMQDKHQTKLKLQATLKGPLL